MLFLINENLQVVSIAFKAAQRSSQANGGQHLAGKNTLARRTWLNVLAYRILKTTNNLLYCIPSRAYAIFVLFLERMSPTQIEESMLRKNVMLRFTAL